MITPEHQKALDAKLQFLEDDWVKKAKAEGVDGKAVLDDLHKIVADYPTK